LQGRPKLFNSVEQAIEYSIRSGSIRNLESARVSIIGQLKKFNTDLETGVKNLGSQSHMVMQTDLAEEDEGDEANSNRKKMARVSLDSSEEDFIKPEVTIPIEKYTWRIDLTKTEKYWKEWFKGLSTMFLGVHVPKLLLLAGVDRLDKELCVGQMQGKFQNVILPKCGHAVHEDSPAEVAEALSNFVLRFKFTESLDSDMFL